MKMNLLMLMLLIMSFSVSQPSYSETFLDMEVIFAEEGEEKTSDEEPDCE
tara:strand:- start:146 stop:295 length:150 start_codon:yes stop_codon:yes gene_type:complete